MSFIEETLAATAVELFSSEDRRVSVEDLAELGWAELFAEEPRAAVGVLAEVQGRVRGVSRLLELVMATQLAEHLDPATTGLVLPLRSLSLPDAGSLSGGLLLAGAPDEVAVPVELGGAVVLLRGVVVADEVQGIDPSAGLRRPRALEVTETVALPAGAWERATSLGLLCVAHETLGVVNALMELAVDHVRNRHQFGVPLGSLPGGPAPAGGRPRGTGGSEGRRGARLGGRDPALCAAALGAARRAFVSARINCHQVMGAMGFTWEHDQHWYLRRGLLLELLLDHRPGLEARPGHRHHLEEPLGGLDMSSIASVGTYLPPWGSDKARVPGLDEDALTMAVEAGLAARSAARSR